MLCDLILEALVGNKKRLTLREISDRVGSSERQCAEALLVLVDEGKVDRKHHRYKAYPYVRTTFKLKA
jgi:DNA-binding Lrp family transcriptional regulator